MLLLGIDLGTSSVKVSVVDTATQQALTSAQYPDTESLILADQPGWAEQDPEVWWMQTKTAIQRCNASGKYNPADIKAIGIAYQMHGLVIVDKNQKILRNSIIWCDSRAVEIGNRAFDELGHEFCLTHLLNSPGNFTAAKLAWIKKNEPATYKKVDKIMLPGDFIAMKLTGEITASPETLSEGIFYDFVSDGLSEDVLNYFGFIPDIFPAIRPVFAIHGDLLHTVALELGMEPGTPVSYKAGDQPNNALSLNVLQPGEMAATAGTSGVIYGVTDQLIVDSQSRINTFVHVNHTKSMKRLGVLLCINGTGSMYRWARDLVNSEASYLQLNKEASVIPIGSNNLRVLPFGNGIERMLNNQQIGAHFKNIDFNTHSRAHIIRAVQEDIAFSFRYGFDMMRENKMSPTVVKAGMANLFLSDIFIDALVNTIGVPIELYHNDGSVGAALGAGIGLGIFKSVEEAFTNIKCLKTIIPSKNAYEPVYEDWLEQLYQQTKNYVQ